LKVKYRRVLFGTKGCSDTIVLRMKRKLRLGKIIRAIMLYYEEKQEGISRGFKVIMSIVLSLFVSGVIASVFNLSGTMQYVLMAGVCLTVSAIVSFKPKVVLAVVCVLVAIMGISFIAGSLNKENVEQLVWDPSLLGAGTSLVAIGVALYALLTQMGRKEGAIDVSESGGGTHNLMVGYVWIEEIKKYRCEYCLSFGKYYYCKTLGGIKRHIASKHV
jgi:hypothetical protein